MSVAGAIAVGAPHRTLKYLGKRASLKAARCLPPLLWLVRFWIIRRYFREHTLRKVHIGSQCHVIAGWLNTEYEVATNWNQVFLDARKRFPFQPESVDYIFTEHMIEHIHYSDAVLMLSECYRVLRKGGKIRIATPDLGRLLRVYTCAQAVDVQRYVAWAVQRSGLPQRDVPRCMVLNHVMRGWGHLFIYDSETLETLLEASGFVNITHHRPGESRDPALAQLESHGNNIGRDMNDFETMVLEACKA